MYKTDAVVQCRFLITLKLKLLTAWLTNFSKNTTHALLSCTEGLMRQQLNKSPFSHPWVNLTVQHVSGSPCFVIHVLNCPRRQSVQRQSVVQCNSDTAGNPWAALDNPAYICFKREVAAFVLHNLHSIHPLQQKRAVSQKRQG